VESSQLNWIANFIWGIADDVLRDLYVRGKYRDVVLPMTVLRRLDAVLEPTKQAVLEMKKSLDHAQITNQDQALRQAADQAFYNTSGLEESTSRPASTEVQNNAWVSMTSNRQLYRCHRCRSRPRSLVSSIPHSST
jgi:type I restriction enzyme M protein